MTTPGADWYYGNSSSGTGSYNPYGGVLDTTDIGSGFGVSENPTSGALTAEQVQFVPNPDIAQVLYKSPMVVVGLGSVVKRAEEIAKGIAPVGKDVDGFGHPPGSYRDSISSAVLPSEGGQPPRGILGSTDPKALWIEFGTGPRPQAGYTEFPAFAVLRRAIQSTHAIMAELGALG